MFSWCILTICYHLGKQSSHKCREHLQTELREPMEEERLILRTWLRSTVLCSNSFLFWCTPCKNIWQQIVVEDNLTCSPGWRDGSWNHSCSCKQFLLFQWSTEHSPGEEQPHLNTHCHWQHCTADTDLDTPPGWWWCPTLWWRQCFPGSNDLTRISD